jgi:hypothetical protein
VIGIGWSAKYITIGKFLIFIISSIIKYVEQIAEKINEIVQNILKSAKNVLTFQSFGPSSSKSRH